MQITIFALLFSMNFARNLYPKLGLENEINPVTEEDSEFARYGHSPAGSMNFDTSMFELPARKDNIAPMMDGVRP